MRGKPPRRLKRAWHSTTASDRRRSSSQDGKVTGVAFRACTRVFDEAGRFSPQFDDSQTSSLAADTVIVAIGQGVDAASMSPVVTGPGGRIVADPETLATNVPGVFAGGDAVLGPASAIDAIAHGHRAAEAIHGYLRGEISQPGAGTAAETKVAPNPNPSARKQARTPMPQAPVEARRRDMREIDLGYSEKDAIAEAQALPQLRAVLGLPPLREGVRAGRHLPRHAAGDRSAPGRRRYPHARLRRAGAVPPGRVRPRALRQRHLVGPVRAHAQRLGPDRGQGAATVRRRAGEANRLHPVRGLPRQRSRQRLLLLHLLHVGDEGSARRHRARCRTPEIAIFCIDVRAFGKEFDRYVDRAANRARRALRPGASRRGWSRCRARRARASATSMRAARSGRRSSTWSCSRSA